MSKKEILAVHKQKLEELLTKLGLWESLVGGELKCCICGVCLSMENIGFIIPSGEEILLCCSNAECIFKIKEFHNR